MILLYGAYGYTGELVARRASAQKVDLVLAGRNEGALCKLAGELACQHRAFDLSDDEAVRGALQGVRVVLNCAGPFSHTALPLVKACLNAHVHYLDITGEIDVFEALAALDEEAKQAGVTLLPGAGFDVVPSDCLAAHVAQRLPNAEHLLLAFATSSSASRGTATTALQNAHKGGWVRRHGKLCQVPMGHRHVLVDLGRGRTLATAIPWGDVATAFHSTGIPNIETFVALPAVARLAMRGASLVRWSPLRKIVERKIKQGPPGPTAEQRAHGWSQLFAQATAKGGRQLSSRLRTPEAYELTSWTALELAKRAHAGTLPVGFQTPSRACGADFILSFANVERTDLG